MKSINLNIEALDLDGKPLETPALTFAKSIASYLAFSTAGDPLKIYDWAVHLNRGLEIILDDSDVETLKTFIKNHQSIPMLIKGPAIKIIDEAPQYKSFAQK